MNFSAGFEFILFLVLFGFSNYLIMLRRYENDRKKRKKRQKSRIAKLYPLGAFIGA